MAAAWLFVVTVAFLLIRAVPGDPVEILLATGNVRVDAAVVAAYREAWGLDQPLVVQFVLWLRGFATLDWGHSLATGVAVRPDLAARLPWSAAIGMGGLALAVASGVTLGFQAAFRPGGGADRLSRVLAVGGQALPAFAVGLVLFWLLAAEWRLIRPLGGGWTERLVLPVLLVALFSVGSMARLSRAAFAQVASQPWLATARAKGLGPRAALWRHGRRSAALVLLAALVPELAWVIGGTAIAEIVFGVPGLSERVVAAVAARDHTVLQAFVALVALWVLIVREAAASARRRLDPRGPR